MRIQAHLAEVISGREGGEQKGKDRYSKQKKDCVYQPSQQKAHHKARDTPASGSDPGIAATSRRVASCSGVCKIFSGTPCSTTLPRSITAISSPKCAAIARSCVIKRYVSAKDDCSSNRRLAICACTEQSRADSASSRITSFGASDSARAMARLCLCT